MKKYFGKFASSGDVQTALNTLGLSAPYVATVAGEGLDFNEKEPDFSGYPLLFEIIADGNIVWKASKDNYKKTLYYTINAPTSNSYRSIESTTEGATIAVKKGDIVKLTSDGGQIGNNFGRSSFAGSTCGFNVYGNLINFAAQGNQAYGELFLNCTGLADASNLNISSAVGNGYNYLFQSMFQGCTNLVAAPILTTETVPKACYSRLFNGCTNLKYIKCLATDISAQYCLDNWVNNVSATGTFVKKAGVTYPSGNNGIPNGWTVIEE